ncbi:hypothetical protein BASA50_003888 [Batrachochytrium salamandrivorans]|uniref:Rubisco LSMT substrate-binding domain-containing protein n=1 Tax=Batrachochytrium salamandrivorans TaxID=1357716 RepID=A0ABQ8FHA6_9FUNG|nr:hypothetical protein BASA62_008696 [Batrachochytrium salamandrivorans]KAH6598274.1 hypothetical protein BASA50_003888 [Batrachochytrium salamandrivorans]KAH6602943.1 hypothetical protein BASA61_000569 [Batrachochytrium salamandrivorans]KAH9266006.1 hypothetical protein BASA84_001350 [Batrachochytrium salamandrivorans]
MSTQLEILEEWFVENKIQYDKENMQIQYNDLVGFSVVAKNVLDVNSILCSIPKEAILSVKNCGIADILEEQELQGALGLTVALMFERSIGTASPWFGYLQSLPQREGIPLFWSQKQIAELKGTAMEALLDAMPSDLLNDYNEHVVPLIASNPRLMVAEKMTFEDFMSATSLVTSRAFQVDCYHGDSMVPLADLFNHRTDTEHVHFETNAQVCYYCGASGPCDCDLISDLDDDDAGDQEWEDLSNDDDCAKNENADDDNDDDMECSDVESASSYPSALYCSNADNSDDENVDSDENGSSSDVIEMIVILQVERGEEIFNTYGVHSNSDLLNRYGFAEANNPYSIVDIPSSSIVDFVAAQYSNRSAIEARLDFLNDNFSSIGQELFRMISKKDRQQANELGNSEDNDKAADPDVDGDVIDPDASDSESSEAEDSEGMDVDCETVRILHEGRPSIVALSLMSILVADRALFTEWKRDQLLALKYFMQVHNGIWDDTLTAPVSKKSKNKSKIRKLIHQSSSSVTQNTATAATTTDKRNSNSPTMVSVYKLLRAICVQHQKNYPTSMDDDVLQLKNLDKDTHPSIDTQRSKFSLVLRIEEKKILKRTLGLCDGILSSCE